MNPVSLPFHQAETWSALNRFCQLPLDSMYFSLSLVFPRPTDICEIQKIVVCVLERARDTSRHGAEALEVKILNWDVTEGFPAIKAASALTAPVKRFHLGVFDYGRVAIIPLTSC